MLTRSDLIALARKYRMLADALGLAAEAARESGYACDAGFVLAVARPPDGRLSAIVYARLEAAFQLEPGELDRVLFTEPSGGFT